MSFVKKITSSRIYNYNIVRSGDYIYIYFMDNSSSALVISQFNLDGELVWEKKVTSNYTVDNNYPLGFQSVAALKDDEILLIGNSGNLCILARMNKNGEIVWSNLYVFGLDYQSLYNPLNYNVLPENDGFILHIPFGTNTNSVLRHHRILKFSYSGQMIFNKKLQAAENISSYYDKLYFHNGKYYITVLSSIIELDSQFNISNKWDVNKNSVNITNLYWSSSDEMIVTGSGSDNIGSFNFCASKVDFSNSINTLLFRGTNTPEENTVAYLNVAFGDDYFYFVDTKSVAMKNANYKIENIVYKYDLNQKLVWTKKYSDENAYNLELKYLDNSILIYYSDFTFGILDTEFDSCNTETIILDTLPEKAYTFLSESSYIWNISDENDTSFQSKQILNIESDSSLSLQTICSDGDTITIDENTLLQSPNFALQAVGSQGTDSLKSVQLRWMLAGNLGAKHLPKGNLASNNTNNYNQPNDFVKIYKTPYIKTSVVLDLTNIPSVAIDDEQYWIYKLNNSVFRNNEIIPGFQVKQRMMYVYFRNQKKYNEIRQTINPFNDPQKFIEIYGENIIEIECKEYLFFGVSPKTNKLNTGNLYLEILSVEENKPVTPKYLSYRKVITPAEIQSSKILAENARSIRYKKQGISIYSFEFEFYSDFILASSYLNSWQLIGNYGLTNTDSLEILNEILGDINGKWLRYNDEEYVNKVNYIDKWNYISQGEMDFKRGIKQTVERYITLSNDANNPRALEYLDINFSNTNEDPQESGDDSEKTEISHLDLLNIAASDYHIARLLGLGTLDISSEILNGEEYVYLSEYKTLKDPQNENINKFYRILSMSLPTSINTERLPLPIEIYELRKGMPKPPGEDIPVLYDDEGYTYDGKNRFISIINKPVPSLEINPSFFPNQEYWDASLFTFPIYAGLEYRVETETSTGTDWQKPELSHDEDYLNVNSNGMETYFETIPIILPEESDDPLFVHRQTISGNYFYSTYGINIFSRVASGNIIKNIVTQIKPKNTLLPPSETKVWLIQPENPLMFTSQFEQNKYNEITNDDKTFVRLNFGYNTVQDMITYSIPADSAINDEDYITKPEDYFPDKYDIFANHIEVYFRKDTPKTISARLYEISDDTDNLCIVFKTKEYYLASTGETLYSVLPQGTTVQNFIGSIFAVNDKSYVIKNIVSGTDGLIFTVYKEEISQTILAGGEIPVSSGSLTTPVTSGNDLFAVMENMQSVAVWGNKNPNPFKVQLPFSQVYREIISEINENGKIQKYLEKSRGYWIGAKIDKFLEDGIHKGIYEIIIPDMNLGTSVENSENAFLEMNNGSVRIFRNNSILNNTAVKTRDVFKVIGTKTQEDGTNILYVYDTDFEFDDDGNPIINPEKELQIGENIKINYYPSYFLYLYKNPANDLTSETVLPAGNEIVKYSIFGLRTVDTDNFDVNGNVYKSRFSTPAVMLGQKIIAPAQPEQPKGSLYATRPDFYGRSTYSFTTKFKQQPYSVQFCRTDNNALLNALYEIETVQEIYENLNDLGGNDEIYLANRWNNFFDFDYLKSPQSGGVYGTYPPEIQNYNFPLPNKTAFFEGINNFIKAHNKNTGQSVPFINQTNYGTLKLNDIIIPEIAGTNEAILLIDFIKEVIDYTFVPLTEIPIIYQYVKSYPDLPVDKKQNIRDKNGYLLNPNDAEFSMAPMMTILNETENITLFTDFTLNGTTDNLYFYASREIGSLMKTGELSEVLGPVKLVSSNPPEAPKILSGLPVLENKVLEINPKIKIDIHSYPDFAGIKKINLYRANNRLDAESILSMKHIKQSDVSEIQINEQTIWTLYDEFEDFEQIPYGDMFYYRITAEKQIQYADSQINADGSQDIIIDYAPSRASKILALMLVETDNPDAPVLKGSGTRPADADFVNNIILSWNTTCYKGIYHLYTMSSQGNWKEIARLLTNKTNDKVRLQVYEENIWTDKDMLDIIDGKISLSLELIGAQYNQLSLFDENGNRTYYHFKAVAENTSNMFSTQENILTLFPDEVWENLQGISSDGISNGMIIETTFIIK